jgi:hypothetical protein
MLTFCSHHEELEGIERDRKGLTGTEIVGVFGKDLVFTGCIFALSRRRQGYETPWDCHTMNKRVRITSFVASQSYVSRIADQVTNTRHKEVKK